jgi:hypothetical protein
MEIANRIRLSNSPREAYNLARKFSHLIKKDWNDKYKNTTMIRVLREKFKQHPKLGQLLIDTKRKLLVEHTENDNYWGDAGNGCGQNMLGKMLMQVRDELVILQSVH